MNWEAIQAVGELLGALGVVISILYLSRQIRQNTEAVRSGNATTVQENFQQLARVFYTDREVGGILLRAMAGEEMEDPADRQAVYAFFFDMLKTVEVSHLKYLNGELDEEFWEASVILYKAYFSTAGFQTYWEERQLAFSPRFRDAVSGWLEVEAPIKKPTVMTRVESQSDAAP